MLASATPAETLQENENSLDNNLSPSSNSTETVNGTVVPVPYQPTPTGTEQTNVGALDQGNSYTDQATAGTSTQSTEDYVAPGSAVSSDAGAPLESADETTPLTAAAYTPASFAEAPLESADETTLGSSTAAAYTEFGFDEAASTAWGTPGWVPPTAPATGAAAYTTTTYPGSAQPLPSAGYNAAPTSLPLGYNAEAAAASEWTSANPSVPQMVNPYESSELAALFGGSTSSGNAATPAATGSQITINITGMTTQNAQSVAQQMVTALKNAGIGKLT